MDINTLNSLPVALGFFDAQGKLTYMNPFWGTLFESPDIASFEANLPTLQPGGITTQEFLQSHLSQADVGEPRELFLVYGRHPKPLSFYKLSITRQPDGHCLVSATVDTNYLYKRSYEHAPFGMSFWSHHLQLTHANPSLRESSGISDEVEYFERLGELFLPTQTCGTPTLDRMIAIREALEHTALIKGPWQYAHIDGSVVQSEQHITKIDLGDTWIGAGYTRDISDTLSAHSDLLKAKEQEQEMLRQQLQVYENTPISIALWDNQPQIMDINHATVELLGLRSKAEFFEQPTRYMPELQACGKPTPQRIVELAAESAANGIARTPWLMMHADGSIINCDLIVSRVQLKDRIIHAAYLQDLRQLSKSYERLIDTKNFNDLLLHYNPVAIDIVEYETNNSVFCNEQALQLFEATDKAHYLANSNDFYPEFQPCGTRSTELVQYYKDLAIAQGSATFEFTYRSKTGKPLSLESTFLPIMQDGKQLLIEYMLDLRPFKELIEQKRNEELNERIKLMFDAAPISIEFWGSDYKLLDCNQHTLESFGFEHIDEYQAYYLIAKQDDCDRWFAHLDAVFEKGYDSFSYSAENPDGSYYDTDVSAVRINLNGQPIVITYSTDTTEIRRIESENQRMQVVEESNRAKSNFLARMSHEIRTPISAVMGISDIHLQKSTLTPELHDALLKINQASVVLLRIINDILDLSKIEAGKLDLIPMSYDLVELIQGVKETSLFHKKDDSVSFVLDLDPTLPRALVGDSVRIKQIISNLLSNAFKYTTAGQVSLSVSACTKASTSEDIVLCIAVKDTGIGMSKQQINAIHDDYSRFHQESHHYIEGTGLGMPIVSNLLKLMSGTIRIESQIDHGTTVFVTLPQRIYDTSPVGFGFSTKSAYAQQLVVQDPEETRQIRGRVLVVDDLETNRYVAKGLLEMYPLAVDTCHSGQAAVDKIKAGKTYDLIFMDYMMAGMDGITALRQLRSIGCKAPVVAFTASTMLGQQERFLNEGFNDFLSKPIQADALRKILRKFLHVDSLALNASGSQNPVLLQRIQSDFVKNHHADARLLREHLGENRLKEAKLIAHSLKTLAAMLSEHTLENLAKQIESQIIQTEPVNPRISPDLLGALEKTLQSAIDAIDLQPPTRLKVAALAPEQITRLLGEAHKHLANNDTAVLKLADELASVPGSAKVVELIEAFSFDEALVELVVLQERYV